MEKSGGLETVSQEEIDYDLKLLGRMRGLIRLNKVGKENRQREAALNQAIAWDLFRVLINKAGAKTESIELFVDRMRNLRSDDQERVEMRRVFNGARAQAGLMHLLYQTGFLVIPVTVELDLLGVDFLAVDKKGKIYCIDTKSQAGNLDRNGEPVRRDEIIVKKMENSQKAKTAGIGLAASKAKEAGEQYIKKIEGNGYSYVFLEVTVPAGREMMNDFGEITANNIRQEAIARISQAKTERWI